MVYQSDESGGPSSRNLLASMAGTSSAFYDLDSEGFGLSSRENIKELVDIPELDITEVEKGLQEKARFTAELAGRLFQAMHVSVADDLLRLLLRPSNARKSNRDWTHCRVRVVRTGELGPAVRRGELWHI